MNKKNVQVIQAALAGNTEAVISLPLSPAPHRQCKALNLPVSPIHARAIRIDMGKRLAEVLLTSFFDRELYPADTFKERYHLRWTTKEVKRHVNRAATNPFSIPHYRQSLLCGGKQPPMLPHQ